MASVLHENFYENVLPPALIDAGQTYRTNPSIDAYTELLDAAIRWYSVEGEESNKTNNVPKT